MHQKLLEEQQKYYDEQKQTLDKASANKKSSVRIAFVIFRSMEGRARALNAYGRGWSFIDSVKQCCAKDDKLRLLGKYNLSVRAATEPDLIQWMNLGVPDNVRLFLAFLNFLLTAAIFISVTGVILWLKNLEDEISEEIPKALPGEFTLKDAEADKAADAEGNSGILTAYCDAQRGKRFEAGSLKLSSMDLIKTSQLCSELYDQQEQVKQYKLVASMALAGINPFAAALLQFFSSLAKMKTLPQQTF